MACVCTCVYIQGICVHIYMGYVCVCACGDQRLMLGIFLSNSIPYFFETSFTVLEAWQFRQPGSQEVPRDPVPSFPVLELRTQVTTPGFLSGFQGFIEVFTLARQGVYLFTDLPNPGVFLSQLKTSHRKTRNDLEIKRDKSNHLTPSSTPILVKAKTYFSNALLTGGKPPQLCL